MLPALPRPLRDLLAVLVVDHRVDAEHARSAAPGLHRLQPGQRAAQEAAVLGLPPGVGDRGLALADDVVVPPPDVRLDRLADRRHRLEVVVVLGRLVGPELAQHPDRRRRRVEDVHPELLGDPPRPPRVRIRRDALVHDARRPQRQRSVDDVGVPGDPADVGEAPVRVVGVDVLVVLRRTGRRTPGSHRSSAGTPSGRPVVPLVYIRNNGASAGIDTGSTCCAAVGLQAARRRRSRAPRPSGCSSGTRPGCRRQTSTFSTSTPSSARNLDRLVGLGLVVDQLAVAVVAVHRHQDLALRVGHPVAARRAR